MKLSRGANICYDLDKSPYKVTLGNLTFYFSSEMHKIKFLEKFEPHRTKISESLSNRFNMYISFNVLSDLVLYRSIETRGFYVTDNAGNAYNKLNLIKLHGVKR